jgi:hypothetical protein
LILTFDGFYSNSEINDFLNNLKNKNINYNEFINTRDYKLYIETEYDASILNYNEISKIQKMFLISKVIPSLSIDEIKYNRFLSNSNNKELIKLGFNDVYYLYNNNSKETVYFINLRSKDNAQKLSKKLGKIYFFGKYNKFYIGLTNNQYTQNIVPLEDILTSGSLIKAEQSLNYEIFNLKYYLKKYSITPYFENGSFILTKGLNYFNDK